MPEIEGAQPMGHEEDAQALAPKAPREAVDAIIARRTLRFRFMKHDAWENALFVHWPVDPAVIRQQLPRGLEPDLYNGKAWVGLVLLTERGVSAHHAVGRSVVRPIDHLGANVRTYVTRNGVPGIFFWSLECSSWLASIGARMAGIPYFPATMERKVDIEKPVAECKSESTAEVMEDAVSGDDKGFVFQFHSQRTWAPGITSWSSSLPSVTARWRLDPGATPADDWHKQARFFVERYSVYAAWPWGSGPLLLRGDVEHPEWKVEPVVIEHLDAEQLLTAAGLPSVASSDECNEARHVCFSRGVGPVNFWMLEPN
mmetsp:Transcript_60117/g.143261  ORF Transcript_60117/g.143261 Transcript_60117/m.143261 type:complete len:314 (+) Transcript_60117:78-1019(+)|eukprot:CAMPEP_0178407058 /NCGR_PEP_ID=MMETSP0689_2-20121128/19232_1 /TAXON_ID=160604 /ORGANISM="Amphidinium massartii, Strain CS-259" /LENGTH=313 /DNA_ID=CAMNT_0020028119 /DNA_START=76 /DNA_END=1017 /DNA_ORIENTATION=+